MILQNPIQATPSTIQNAYGLALNTATKSTPTSPTSAVSEYAIQPTASSPVLAAFFQTLSQVDEKSQLSAAASSSGAAQLNSLSSIAPNNQDTANALQGFTYALFQNLQNSASNNTLSSKPSVDTGLGPLSNITFGANTTYLNNLPSLLDNLSTSVNNGSSLSGPGALEGLKTAYKELVNSLGANGASTNVDTSNTSSLAAFLQQMSQKLQSQEVTSLNTLGSFLDTKA